MKIPATTRKHLRRSLAELLPEKAQVQSICRDTDINLARVNLDGTPEIRWAEVLAEVERQGPEVLKRLLKECLETAPDLRGVVDSAYSEIFPGESWPSGKARSTAASTAQKPDAASGRSTATAAHSVFLSYAHEDERMKAELEMALALLQRQGKISIWDDRKIKPGDEWDGTIAGNLEKADMVLLLISPSFLASDFCYDRELKVALERQAAGHARVIPIILKPCDWQSASFGKLQALPTDGKAITTWSNRDDAWLNVVQVIRMVLE